MPLAHCYSESTVIVKLLTGNGALNQRENGGGRERQIVHDCVLLRSIGARYQSVKDASCRWSMCTLNQVHTGFLGANE